MGAGELRHRVTLETPSAAISNGDGGFVHPEPWPVLAYRIAANVKPASARDLERLVSGTVQSSASHLVKIRYMSGVTTQERLVYHDITDRAMAITGVIDLEERHVWLVLSCEETVQ
jgi:head-tail adaptor